MGGVLLWVAVTLLCVCFSRFEEEVNGPSGGERSPR